MTASDIAYYLGQGGCVFVIVCLLATLHENFQVDLHEILREGWQWAIDQMITFLCQSRTDSPDGGTDVAILVRRTLMKVCTVLVLLVRYFYGPSAYLFPTHSTELEAIMYCS